MFSFPGVEGLSRGKVCFGLVGTLEWWMHWQEEVEALGEDVVVCAGSVCGIGTG